MTLKSILGKCDRTLKKYCREKQRQGESSSASVWVTDNYPSVSSALKAAKGFISSKGEKDLMPLFLLCKEFFSKKEKVTPLRLSSFFSGEKLNLFQCEALSYLLYAGAAAVICDNLSGKDDELIISCVKNILFLRDISFEELLYDISSAERYLAEDPAGIYENMSAETKKVYREAVRKAAEKEGISESGYVKNALKEAYRRKCHIGFCLPVNKNRKKYGILYIACEWIASAFLSVIIGLLLIKRIYAPFVLLFPVYSLIKPISDRIAARLFSASFLPSMDRNSVSSGDTLITVSSLLPMASESDRLFEHLAEIYSSVSLKNVKLLLLLDMKNSSSPERAEDETDISAVRRVIDRLNERFSGGFSVIIRERVYSPTENEYTGFERKRGAICALMKYLRDGNAAAFGTVYGDTSGFSEMKYVLALDSDTKLSFNALTELVAAACHPLNKPVFSSEKKRVVSGFGIIAPRIETSIDSSGKTLFSKVYTNGGSVSYAPFVSERYSDMFGETVFSGKGLIDIEMFDTCIGDKFDEQRILSHDILEGAVLRTAFHPFAELTDSFPSAVSGYFSRLHRWIRGDIQNLKYMLFPLGKSESAPRMHPLGKYQLFDNFRRALTPVIAFMFVILSCFSYGKAQLIFLLTGLLSVCFEYIISLICSFLRHGILIFSSLYLSSEISAAYKEILRILFSAGSLPVQAVICADAIIKAIYRSLVSKKKLLSWLTAAETEKAVKNDAFTGIVFPVLSVAFLFFFGSVFHRFAGLIFFSFIPLTVFRGIKLSSLKEKGLSFEEKRVINSFAAASWRFFEENVTAFENWLPPDNIQETPVPRKAKRTSPTNIGFYLVSTLAAADLSFITAEEMNKRINNTLDTLERLPKYKGLLYNWYDTVKAVPLKPSYVSAVDCGNYLCCLTALKEGLREYGNTDSIFYVTSQRIEKILDSSDLSVFYDKQRQLFRIGIDGEDETVSSSFYDYYMSEARMTSYYAVARRQVPSSHWRSLDRTLKRSKSFVTAVSWTGTMFEYFMPVLFLRNVPGSFQYEALKVCLYMQKKRAARENIPYGISESGFFSVDSALNYRYKAHGIKELAAKRNADDESVISPYSTFLTLPFDRKCALKNLSRLSQMHLEGRCGFYEAVDFSEKRTDGEEYAVVRSYMSHHVGMSMIAAANTLSENAFVRRFMMDVYMNSAKSLLEEKIPSHPGIFSGISKMTLQNKKEAKFSRSSPEKGEFSFAWSNGEVTLLADKFGRNRCIFAGADIYKYSQRSKGISVGIDMGDGIRPLFGGNENSGISLEKYAITSAFEENGFSVKGALCVHPSCNALLIPVKIRNPADKDIGARLCFYVEPQLQPVFFDDSHPAFSDMFLSAQCRDKHRALIFSRQKDDEMPCVAIGFYSKENEIHSLDREKVLNRNPDRENVFTDGFDFEKSDIRGVSPVAALSTKVQIPAQKSIEAVLIMALSGDRKGALSELEKVRLSSLSPITKGAPAIFLRDELTFSAANKFVSRVFFDGQNSEIKETAKAALRTDMGALWQTGISGDYPIITVFAEKDCPAELQRAYVKLYKRLIKSSLPVDLVFIFESTSEYGFSGEKELNSILYEENASDCVSKKGGIHILSISALSKESFAALTAFSSVIYPEKEIDSQVTMNIKPHIHEPEIYGKGQNKFIVGGYIIREHPAIPWCHTLSNPVFGTLLSDSSLGYTWALNSRQNKLSPWSNDTASDMAGERLFIEINGKVYDAVKNCEVTFSENCAVYRSVAENILLTVTVETAKKGMRKRIKLELRNMSGMKQDLRIFYCVKPVLGETERLSEYVKIRRTEDGVTVKNPLNNDFGGVMCLTSSGDNPLYCDSTEDFFGYKKKTAAILQKIVLYEKNIYEVSFFMSFAKTEEAVKKLARLPFYRMTENGLMVKSPYKNTEDFFSGLLYHQVKDTRLTARCGFYQCSGAFGFRDQLQDILPLIGRDNRTVKKIIYKAASAQFAEGDVLHWFHIYYDKGLKYKGVRTRISDDLLWLPYAVIQYVNKTGDRDILSVKIPFLGGNRLSSDEKERYEVWQFSDEKGTLFEHCVRALGKGLKKGEHGLCLMGTGDWNDSFDSVGEKLKGESVWLSMFMRNIFLEFAKICDIMKEQELQKYLLIQAGELCEAIEKYAWNGKWYIRGFYDDGSSLGDEGNAECETDIICQAWASLGDMPDKNRVRAALLSAFERLFDEKNGVIRLFSPPFTANGKKTGYVNFYPPGMRENGGQYTHAAVWFCKALYKEGLKEQAEKVFFSLLPSEKYKSGNGDIFKTEPYALAGDVYHCEGHIGRGGWSLYTGSAGWLIQLADELLR